MAMKRVEDSGAIGVLVADVGRDRVTIQVRLDKVVLTVSSDQGSSDQVKLTPADAREVVELLRQAAAAAEKTPGS